MLSSFSVRFKFQVSSLGALGKPSTQFISTGHQPLERGTKSAFLSTFHANSKTKVNNDTCGA
jgi:hypothetical protein